jgi:hypothetical protein
MPVLGRDLHGKPGVDFLLQFSIRTVVRGAMLLYPHGYLRDPSGSVLTNNKNNE